MKKILLLIFTTMNIILIIIAKDTNIFLSFLLLFTPLIIDIIINKKDGITITKYNKVTILFYVVISIMYYFITYNFLDTIILLLLMTTYYLYRPKLILNKEYIYINRIIFTKKAKIDTNLIDKYKRAGFIIDSQNKYDIDETSLVANNIKDLENYYFEIEKNRIKYENLVRSRKYQLVSSFIIPLIITFIFVFQIPNPLNNTILLTTYFLLSITNIFLSVFLPSEQDIMERNPRKPNDTLFSKEEKLFIIVNIFSTLIAITIPYMIILYSTENTVITSYVFIVSLIITNLINVAYHLNDSLTVINLIKYIFNKIYMSIIITSLTTFIIMHQFYDKYNLFKPINYLKLVIIIIIAIGWEDIIKIARFTKKRKRDKQ